MCLSIHSCIKPGALCVKMRWGLHCCDCALSLAKSSAAVPMAFSSNAKASSAKHSQNLTETQSPPRPVSRRKFAVPMTPVSISEMRSSTSTASSTLPMDAKYQRRSTDRLRSSRSLSICRHRSGAALRIAGVTCTGMMATIRQWLQWYVSIFGLRALCFKKAESS